MVQAGAFKALAGSSTHKKTCPTVGLFGPWFKTGRTRSEKKSARELVRSAFRWAPTTHIGLFCAGPWWFQRKNFSSENTTRVRSKGFATDREHAHALQHVKAKVQPCQAVLRCQSRRTDWLEAPRSEIFGARSESAAASGCDLSGAPRRSCLSFDLMLSSDQSGRNARISRGFRPSSSHWHS